jgi:antitoxin ParD1/3/4
VEDAINTALLLLADELGQQNPEATPGYLAWVEQTRLEIDKGLQAAEQGEVLEADVAIARLRQKVNAAKPTSA